MIICLFILVHVGCNFRNCIKLLNRFFQHVPAWLFNIRRSSIIPSKSFFFQTAFNFKTIDINFNIMRGKNCRSYSLTNKNVAFFWVSFHSVIFKPCKHITRAFFQWFNNFTCCAFIGISSIVSCLICNLTVISK